MFIPNEALVKLPQRTIAEKKEGEGGELEGESVEDTENAENQDELWNEVVLWMKKHRLDYQCSLVLQSPLVKEIIDTDNVSQIEQEIDEQESDKKEESNILEGHNLELSEEEKVQQGAIRLSSMHSSLSLTDNEWTLEWSPHSFWGKMQTLVKQEEEKLAKEKTKGKDKEKEKPKDAKAKDKSKNEKKTTSEPEISQTVTEYWPEKDVSFSGDLRFNTAFSKYMTVFMHQNSIKVWLASLDIDSNSVPIDESLQLVSDLSVDLEFQSNAHVEEIQHEPALKQIAKVFIICLLPSFSFFLPFHCLL